MHSSGTIWRSLVPFVFAEGSFHTFLHSLLIPFTAMFDLLISPQVSQQCLYSAAAGMLSHWLYFIRGETHLEAPRLAALAIVLPVLIVVFQTQYGGLDPQ
jgi:hypothetical protein